MHTCTEALALTRLTIVLCLTSCATVHPPYHTIQYAPTYRKPNLIARALGVSTEVGLPAFEQARERRLYFYAACSK